MLYSKTLLLVAYLAFYPYEVKQVESKCHEFFSQAKIHKFSKIDIIYIYVYKSFCTILDKGLRKNIKKRDGEIVKQKLNKMAALNMKQKK